MLPMVDGGCSSDYKFFNERVSEVAPVILRAVAVCGMGRVQEKTQSDFSEGEGE